MINPAFIPSDDGIWEVIVFEIISLQPTGEHVPTIAILLFCSLIGHPRSVNFMETKMVRTYD